MIKNKRFVSALATGLSCALLTAVSCGDTAILGTDSITVSGDVKEDKTDLYASAMERDINTGVLTVVKEREKAEMMAKEQAEKEQEEKEREEEKKRAREQEEARMRAEAEKAAQELAAASQAEDSQTQGDAAVVEVQPSVEQEVVQSVAVAPSDQELLASIIFCEAGNQPYEGQVAVGAVIMNRIRSGAYPNSISEVIYQPGQFGPAMTGWLDQILASGGYTDTAMQAAADAIAGVNPIGDCLYFGNGDYGILIGDHYFH